MAKARTRRKQLQRCVWEVIGLARAISEKRIDRNEVGLKAADASMLGRVTISLEMGAFDILPPLFHHVVPFAQTEPSPSDDGQRSLIRPSRSTALGSR